MLSYIMNWMIVMIIDEYMLILLLIFGIYSIKISLSYNVYI